MARPPISCQREAMMSISRYSVYNGRTTMKAFLAGFLTLALTTAGYAETLNKAKLDQFFDRIAEKNKGMGNVVVARDGKVLYARSIGDGVVNGTKKEPLTAASRFRIGSISK